jgi:hypothetical protein
MLQEHELIVDSAEQARMRPSDYQEQKKYYSGKKKFHSFKNQLIVLSNGADIVDVIAGKHGELSPEQKRNKSANFISENFCRTYYWFLKNLSSCPRKISFKICQVSIGN